MDLARCEEYLRQLVGCASEVRRYVAGRVGNHADAEDIVQQALLQAWVNLGAFRGGNVRAWLFTIARRLVADLRRERGGLQFLEAALVDLAESEPALQTSPDAVQIICECRARLGSWMECLTLRLPLEEQVAVLLADVHGYRDRESAAALGISLPSFKRLLHRARGRLRTIAGGRCVLLENGPAAQEAADPVTADHGRAGENAACANGCPDSNCRLGIKCCRHVPRLLSMRRRLMDSFLDCLQGSDD